VHDISRGISLYDSSGDLGWQLIEPSEDTAKERVKVTEFPNPSSLSQEIALVTFF